MKLNEQSFALRQRFAGIQRQKIEESELWSLLRFVSDASQQSINLIQRWSGLYRDPAMRLGCPQNDAPHLWLY